MTVYLLLGSNRGASARAFDAALAALPALGVRVRTVSPYRCTAPVGATGRRLFMNCAVEAETHLLPRVLLRRLHHLEQRMGRHLHGRRNPPRTLDIDLIFYDRARIRTRELAVPHPRYAQRRFVLQCLADIAPTLHAPRDPRSVHQRLQSLVPSPQSLFPSSSPPLPVPAAPSAP